MEIKPKTLSNYQGLCKRVLPFLGKKNVQELRPRDFDCMMRQLAKEGYPTACSHLYTHETERMQESTLDAFQKQKIKFCRQIRRQEINTPLKHAGWRGLENANSCFDDLGMQGQSV